MTKTFITFPVNLNIHEKEKQVVALHKGWRDLTSSIPSQNHCGILTGKINNITVVDIDCDSPFIGKFDNLQPLNVDTPSGGCYYLFQYEESLQSIYHTLDRLSIYNNQSCVFFGDGYKILNEVPIPKMDPVFLMALQSAQANREEEVIDQEIYELLNILPYEWFNNEEQILQLIHVLRNQVMAHNSRRISTMRRLLIERSECYHERLLQHYFKLHMTYKQQRFGLCALTKIIKKDYPSKYEAWLQTWNPKKSKLDANMAYKKGAMTKLSELKAAYKKGNLTANKLLELNSDFTVTKIHICKSCMSKHVVNCCSKYKREASTTCLFINNIELV